MMNQFKKLTAMFFMMVVLTVTLMGCAQKVEEETGDQLSFKAGQYTALADGKNGPVEVIVTFDDHSIVSVEVGEHSETEGIADAAIERVPQQIIEGQTLAVDGVSGASLIVNAILAGVEDCVAQAGGDIEALKVATENSSELAVKEIEKTVDVVIVGAGASGLTAGISASELGADVLIIEKGVSSAVSNGANAGGPIAVGTKAQAAEGEDLTMETLYTHMSAFAQSTINDALLRKTLEVSGETVDMLDELGLTVTLRQDAYGVGFRARHKIAEKGIDRTGVLEEEVRQNGGEFMFETTGEKVLVDANGNVVGLEATQSDGTKVKINAKAVLLATGGYLGSKEKITEKFGDITVNPLGNTLSTGDGINMALEVGGLEDKNFGIVANEFSASNEKAGIWSKDSNQNLRFGIYGGLLVNSQGNRFFNEQIMADEPLSAAEATLREGKYYAVLDEAYYTSVETVGIFETLGSPESWVAGVRNLSAEAPAGAHVKVLTEARAQLDEAIEQGWAYKADTIEELAEYFGLDNLVETVKTYNEMAAAGKDTQFYKDSVFLTPITEGPFYVFEYEPSAWCTIGGVKVDDSLRVVDSSNQPVNGLYAAGMDAGSLFTAPYYDNEGSAFGLSLASGTLAGREIVEYLNTLK